MTSSHEQHEPDPGRFDWQRAEQELSGRTPDKYGPDDASAGSAEVVDLSAARGRRTPDTDPDTTTDTTPATRPDTDPDVRPDTTPDTEPDSTEVLEGELLPPVGAEEVVGPPEWKRWAWTVGWRHKWRRFWVYKWRYLWNTLVVLGAWSARSVWWWLRGLGRAVADFSAFVDDRQGLQVADQTAGGVDGKADVDAWLKVRNERHRELRDRRKVIRTRVALPVLVLLAGVGAAVWLGHGATVRQHVTTGAMLAWLAVGCWLVWYGRARTQPFWPTFREPSPYPPVSNDIVTGALLATGIGQLKDLVKAGHSPVDVIYRDDAAGGKIAETHPVPGVTTDMLEAKAIVLAGALRRPPAMVHVSQAPSGVPGHVELLVLDIDPGKQKPPGYAYHGKKVNVGQPCTIGHDPRNRPVRWMLPGTNGITTGTPGSGKTAYLIQLACLAADDVEGADLGIFDFKGMGDYAECERVCFAYNGDADTTEVARQLLAALRRLKKEVERRKKILTKLKSEGSDLLDNNAAALTDRLARAKKYNMRWILFIIDEIHEALADAECGEEIIELLIKLHKIGRACGLHFEIASQRTDAESIKTAISSLATIRVAFHQNGQRGNDDILGTGAYKRGIDATAFRRGVPGSDVDDRGSCWYIGSEGGVPVKVRTNFVLKESKKIMARSLAGRTKAGTLTGAAAGIIEQPETPSYSALDDVRAVFLPGEDALHGDVIFHRVNTRHPGRWKSQNVLMAAMRSEAPQWNPQTIDIGRIRPADAPNFPGVEKTRKGIRRDQLDKAIAAGNPDDTDGSAART